MPPSQNPPDAAAAPNLGGGLRKRFRFEGCFTRGGMADVWLVWDEVIERPCVFKVATRDAERERLRREAHIGAKLHGDGTAQVYDLHLLSDRRTPYVIFEFLDGPTLTEYVAAAGGRLDYRNAVKLVARAAAALAPAHAAGIVHRDIKPGNIMVRERYADIQQLLAALDGCLRDGEDAKPEGAPPDVETASAPETAPIDASARPAPRRLRRKMAIAAAGAVALLGAMALAFYAGQWRRAAAPVMPPAPSTEAPAPRAVMPPQQPAGHAMDYSRILGSREKP